MLWKIDLYLIPWLCLLYLTSFLDRTNIGNARILGLQKDLHITDNQYLISLTVFFISYSLFEPATQIMLKYFKPSVFLPVTMGLWGIVMVTMGLCHNFGGLITARWFLGLFEAGLFPGVQFYLSCWYKRSEFGIRSAIFFSAAALAGSFGGLLAAAIGKMNGIGGKPGWAWIFIIEGLATFLVGIGSFWMVHDFPDEAKFLTPEERARVLRRLASDQQGSSKHEDFQIKFLKLALTDWKTYSAAVIYMGCDGALYAFSLFLPTIIANLGYSSTKAQLLSVPPYAVAACMTVAIGFFADRTGFRGYSNMIMALIGVAGFSMLVSTGNPHIQYAGTFLGAVGIYPCIANTITWTANNTEGVYKRGIVLGIVIGWGNLNGIVSSNIYRAPDKPRYIPGHATVLAYLGALLFGGSVVQHIGLRIENKKRRDGKRDHLVEGKNDEQIEELGDMRPDFQYTL